MAARWGPDLLRQSATRARLAERLQKIARGRQAEAARRQNVASRLSSARRRAEAVSQPAISHASPRVRLQELRRTILAKREYRDPSLHPTSRESPRTKRKETQQHPATGNSSETRDCATMPQKTNHREQREKSDQAAGNSRAGSSRANQAFPRIRERLSFAGSSRRAMSA